VEELRKNLGTVAGKTNMDEFGMGSHSTNSTWGPVTNIPPFENVSVGGSSGGSAVAVATKQCGLGLGTDTGGSVRLPAAYTGVAGFKPSYGQISRFGVVPYANSLDTVGILAQSAEAIRQAYTCIAQPDSRDQTSFTENTRSRIKEVIFRSRKTRRARRIASKQWDSGTEDGVFTNLRIGIPSEYNIEELEDGVRQVWKKTLELFQSNGATLVPISLPNTKHALSAYYVLAPAEASSNLSKYDGVRYGARSNHGEHVLFARTRGDGFGLEVKQRILLGSYTLSSEARDNYFLKAQKVRRLVQRDFDLVFGMPNPLLPPQQFDLSDLEDTVSMEDKLGPREVDFIVCPTAPTAAPLLGYVRSQTPVHTYTNDVFTVPASLAGLPALSVPFTISQKYEKPNHPNYAGIQIIGQVGDDNRVLDIGEKLEALRDIRGLFYAPMSQQVVVRDGMIDALRSLYQADRQGLVAGSRPIRKVRVKNFNKYFKPQREQEEERDDWGETSYESTTTPNIRPVPTYSRKDRPAITDKEISKDLEDALGLWERIKRPGED
jgi:aspartyl-tRNA(Asn)/glutamyl-tRNA(Gln) amidotransferase subunit A